MTLEDDNVTELPVKFKERPEDEGRLLFQPYEVGQRKCEHFLGRDAQIIVDDKLDTVECGKCGERLNPMAVLAWLCQKESQFAQARERYKDEMKRLRERSRTKCRACGAMTPISRK